MTAQWTELLMRDHETTEKVFEAGERILEAAVPDPLLVQKLLDYFVGYVEACHNRKEEDHLFPLIEKRGIPRQGGPLAVMLMEHEQSKQVLAQLKTTGADYVAGKSEALDPLRAVYAQYIDLLKNHFWKENDILYPLAQRVMAQADGDAVVAGIEATEAACGPDTRAKYYALADELIAGGAVKDLVHGLDYDMIGAMLNTLPIELSFVDAENTVRYFSHENHAKIFPRTRGAIGMKVQNCHPQKSVHLVNHILEDFKAGKREVAEFWIKLQGKEVHIRYFPVHGNAGEYLGCLETVQDITPIKALSGERRLLDES
ncbi:MAG: PAS domain-containing protein [Xanthomonadales bacterium]|jgi:DUF438 domain-containing protein|nr:PAS domain-containing protein [Xanthomonadales bacterium]